MIAYVFRPKRKDRNGKTVISRCYRSRYRLDGEYSITEVSLKTADKQVAKKRLTEIITEKQREQEGLIPPKPLRESARKPVLEHLREFLEDLKVLGRSEKHRNQVKSFVMALVKQCQWQYVSNVTPDSFIQWRSKQNLSPKTLNEYLSCIRSLLNWMERNGRIQVNPLKPVAKIDGRGKERHKRRALSLKELQRLLKVAEKNRLTYLTASYTGLRRMELEKLVWDDIFLKSSKPFLRVRSETAKNKKQAFGNSQGET